MNYLYSFQYILIAVTPLSPVPIRIPSVLFVSLPNIFHFLCFVAAGAFFFVVRFVAAVDLFVLICCRKCVLYLRQCRRCFFCFSLPQVLSLFGPCAFSICFHQKHQHRGISRITITIKLTDRQRHRNRHEHDHHHEPFQPDMMSLHIIQGTFTIYKAPTRHTKTPRR